MRRSVALIFNLLLFSLLCPALLPEVGAKA